MVRRSNEDWLWALQEPATEAHAEALQDLRDFLLRAVLVYLSQRRSDLAGWSRQDVRDLAEDLAQESLIEIDAKVGTFRGDSQFTTWAFRFVINRAATELRRKRYRNLSLDDLREDELVAFQNLLYDREKSVQDEPARLAERRQFVALLQDIIRKRLTERQRFAIVGVYWQERSMDQVAEALGLDRNALYKLLHDARKRIKDELLARHLSQGDILAIFEN